MSSRIPAIFDAKEPCSPLSIPNSQTALLLLDYQNLVTASLGDDATRAVSVAHKMQRWAVENQIVVVHCLVETKGQTPKPSMKMAGRFKILQGKLQETPTLGNEDERLARISAEEKFDKRMPGYISALQGPKLREMLDARKVKSLILAGLSTSGCLLSTCRAATDAEYIVTVVEDGCADPVPGLHDMLMTHVISSTAHVARGDELMEVWKTKS
jgi:nicotinamidase-related amidase